MNSPKISPTVEDYLKAIYVLAEMAKATSHNAHRLFGI